MAKADSGESARPTGPRRLLPTLALPLMLLLALGIRLFDLTDPPLDFHPTRQLRSAMIARGMYYAGLDDVPEWQREMAPRQQDSQEALEPTILETLVAFAYRLAGGEHLWLGRLFSSFFWVAGGLALYGLGKDLSSHDGALVGTAYFLFLPFAVFASRSFQPEPAPDGRGRACGVACAAGQSGRHLPAGWRPRWVAHRPRPPGRRDPGSEGLGPDRHLSLAGHALLRARDLHHAGDGRRDLSFHAGAAPLPALLPRLAGDRRPGRRIRRHRGRGDRDVGAARPSARARPGAVGRLPRVWDGLSPLHHDA